MSEREYYEDNEDVVDSYDQLNEKYKNSDWIKESFNSENVKNDDLNPIEAYKRLILPSDVILDSLSSEFEYKQRETDPYQRILNLKEELLSTKQKIDEHAERFKDNVYIKETENATKALGELDLYKTKIDAFLKYDMFNKINNEQSDRIEELDDDSASSNNSRLNSQSTIEKKEFYSVFEKYTRITENLISQIKMTEHDLINKNWQDLNVRYEIFANPEMQMENLLNRISELEDMITNLERTLGNWINYNSNESISLTLTKLLNFTAAKMSEKYDKKYQTFKECGNLITSFLEKKKEKLESGSYFLKIKELYAILELYEHFDQVFDYVKKRIKAIKEIYDNSDQFTNLLHDLSNTIAKNEERFQKLLTQYEDTLKTFEEFDSVLKDLGEIDNIIKDKLLK